MLEATGEEIATTLIMERNGGDGRLVVVVEGDDECALLDVHANPNLGKTHLSGSKTAVLEAAAEFDREGISWVKLLVDADLDVFNGSASTWPSNVLVSEHYDLLADVVFQKSEIIDAVVLNYVRQSQLSRWQAATGLSVIDLVTLAAKIVGSVRHAIVAQGLPLSARRWNFVGMKGIYSYNDLRDWASELAEMRSAQRVTKATAANFIDNYYIGNIAPHLLCAHDLIGCLNVVIDDLGGGTPGIKNLAVAVRLALGCKAFLALKVVTDIRTWSAMEHSMEIFSCATV